MPVSEQPVGDFIDLLDPRQNQIFNMSPEEATSLLHTGDPESVRSIRGSFALVSRRGREIFMARSIGRPMRYFLAKQEAGPLLVVAERIDEIADCLKRAGYGEQFRPDYTRMVPAHYLVRLELVGCPDPNPHYRRYFTPPEEQLDADLDAIGKTYISALAESCRQWLEKIPEKEPVGVLFSGGIDSGSVFLVLYHLMLKNGMNPSRLKAFTLSLGDGPDAEQAYRFLDRLGLSLFFEPIEASPADIDYRKAIEVIEDYKLRDVEAATVTLALCKKIRERYPHWRYLADGDGGDENLKAYPIEENPELTIRSVLNNPLLYHEGWGVDKIKHSLTYSGGQSRGHVRSYATARHLGFTAFSPYTLPDVIEVSERIPFIHLTQWKHEELYSLKGDVVRRGIKAVTGMDMPVFPKRRFQHGVTGEERTKTLMPASESECRAYFSSLYGR